MFKTDHYKRFLPGFSLDHVLVGGPYDQEMQKKIHRFKFAKNPVDRVYFESLFALLEKEFSGTVSTNSPADNWIIVYPPVSLLDRIKRGSNHAKALANSYPNEIGRQILCPFKKKFLAGHQSRRSRADRKVAMGEYSLRSEFVPDIQGKRVILVDDLITTGYTAHILGKLLKNAGAKEVDGFFLSSEKIL